MGSKVHLQVTFELESNDDHEALEILDTLERALSIVCELSPFVEELDKHYFKDGNEVDLLEIIVKGEVMTDGKITDLIYSLEYRLLKDAFSSYLFNGSLKNFSENSMDFDYCENVDRKVIDLFIEKYEGRIEVMASRYGMWLDEQSKMEVNIMNPEVSRQAINKLRV